MKDKFSASSLETAMSAWEAVLEMRSDHPEIQRTFETIGTSHLRLAVARWTELIDAAWEKVSNTYDAPFDWQFVPEWIAQHIDWSGPEPIYVIGGRS